MDPLNLGRVRVRCFGNIHSEDKTQVPTNSLPWAHVIMPTTSASISGVGASPSGLVEGAMVFGFFVDGIDKQRPCILGSLHAIPQGLANPFVGFNDPRTNLAGFPGDSTYPKFVDEPDTNRLARNESIADTIVTQKQLGLDTTTTATGVPVTEPQTAYNAVFPFNHVEESESGHIREVDDTPGAERLHEWHRSGTFREVGPDGTVVEKTVGGHHEVKESDAVEHVLGDKHVIVDGEATLKVTSGPLTLVVSGGTVEIQASEINIVGDVNVTGTITATTDVVAGVISLVGHTHTGVTSGPSNTGPAV